MGEAVSEEEPTPTLRGATLLHLLMTRGPITARELAREMECHRTTVYRALVSLELSRRFVVVYERPYWRVVVRDES